MCEDNHCETLQANIDAACYRNNGQTRRDNAMPRAYITLVPVFGQLHACATLHCARDSREREREGGERSSSISGKSVFHHRGERGFVEGVSLDGRLSQPKWDSRVVGNLLCCCWRGDSDTRPKGNLFARETRAIDCNCVWIGYGDWLWQAGWRVDKFLIMGLLFSRFEGFVGYSGKYWESCDLASGELFIRRNLVQIYKYIVFLVTHIVVRYYLISFDSFSEKG